MKLFFLEAKANIDVEFPQQLVEKLPQSICLAASVQFADKLQRLMQQLETAGKKVSLVKGKHAKHFGQILGCSYSKLEFDKDVGAFLYVGDGLFHPKALLLGSDKEVYCFNPFTKAFSKLDRADTARLMAKERAALAKFLHSTEIGVVISVKPGQLGLQESLKSILGLKQMFPEKNFYFLVADTIDIQQLANFSFIECFLNTACNRMIDDYEKFPKPVVNLEEVLKAVSTATKEAKATNKKSEENAVTSLTSLSAAAAHRQHHVRVLE